MKDRRRSSRRVALARHRGQRTLLVLDLRVTAIHKAVPGLGASGVLDLLAAAPVPSELLLTTLLNELGPYRKTCGWSSTTTTWSAITESAKGSPSCWSTSRRTSMSCSAPGPTPICRWPGGGRGASWSRSGRRTCGSPPRKPPPTSPSVGHELTAGDIEVLEERTEGWIAALQLAALSLQGRADVSGFITRFAGDDRYIVDYLIEEVLTHQPDAVRDS